MHRWQPVTLVVCRQLISSCWGVASSMMHLSAGEHCTLDSGVTCNICSYSRCGSRRRKQLGTAQLPPHSSRSHSSRSRSRLCRQARSNICSGPPAQLRLWSALSRPRCCPTSRSRRCWPAVWAPRYRYRRRLHTMVSVLLIQHAQQLQTVWLPQQWQQRRQNWHARWAEQRCRCRLSNTSWETAVRL